MFAPYYCIYCRWLDDDKLLVYYFSKGIHKWCDIYVIRLTLMNYPPTLHLHRVFIVNVSNCGVLCGKWAVYCTSVVIHSVIMNWFNCSRYSDLLLGVGSLFKTQFKLQKKFRKKKNAVTWVTSNLAMLVCFLEQAKVTQKMVLAKSSGFARRFCGYKRQNIWRTYGSHTLAAIPWLDYVINGKLTLHHVLS